MYLIRNQHNLPDKFKHAVVTIGNFDGVHLGHQKLLHDLVKQAKSRNKPSGVIIFEPQPQEFFSQHSIARLTTFRQKYQLIKQQGIDFMLVLRFNAKLAQQSAENFIHEVLVEKLHISEIWLGEDFRFGHQRLGDVALLKQQGKVHGFQVHSVEDVNVNNTRISSTHIRRLLAQGELQQAHELLGRFYTIVGKVIAGAARGRVLGMPTANILPPFAQVPVQGIFVVRVGWDKQEWPGVASLGMRPVFAGKHLLLEVHIFNFAQNIYHKRLTVEFIHKLRDEADFESIELLKEQMHKDLLDAQHFWKHRYD